MPGIPTTDEVRHTHRLCQMQPNSFIHILTKVKNVRVLVIALLTRLEQQRFTILEVAADWHELMIPWRIMRPSIARDGDQLDPRCSTQTYHRPRVQKNPFFK